MDSTMLYFVTDFVHIGYNILIMYILYEIEKGKLYSISQYELWFCMYI